MFDSSGDYLLLTHIGAMIEKLVGNGFVSEYSRKNFKTKYLKIKLNQLVKYLLKFTYELLMIAA